jgi:hypothetical protein
MSLQLFCELRKTVNVHDMAQHIRRAIGSHQRPQYYLDKRHGNTCSVMVRVTPMMAANIERESHSLCISASRYIEACCWELLSAQKQETG